MDIISSASIISAVSNIGALAAMGAAGAAAALTVRTVRRRSAARDLAGPLNSVELPGRDTGGGSVWGRRGADPRPGDLQPRRRPSGELRANSQVHIGPTLAEEVARACSI